MRHASLPVITVTALALGLGACAQNGNGGGLGGKTGSGALIGALGGAAIGAATGEDGKDRLERGLAGAAIGGVAGGAVGAYMDSQEKDLRQNLQNTPAEVQRVGETIVVTVPSDVTFPHDSAQLQPQARQSLNEVAQTLRANPNTTVDVVGHTDSTGAADYNIDLSLRRAESVMTYLQRQGVAPNRIEAFGAGETRPVATNDTDYGRQQNRRVEIRIDPVRS